MLADNIDFLPKTRLSELREYATKHVINPPAPAPVFSYQSITAPPGISNIEKAECLEALGIIEFYEGNWNQAEQYLHQSLNDYTHEQSRRLPRRLVYVKLLLGIALFRNGNVDKADAMLEKAIQHAKQAELLDLTAFALSNRALVLSKTGHVPEAVRLSRMAVEISSSLYDSNSFEHLQHVRILITLLIRSREFHKAEHMLDEHEFSRQERALLLAGVHFAAGQLHRAAEILSQFTTQPIKKTAATTANAPNNDDNTENNDTIVQDENVDFEQELEQLSSYDNNNTNDLDAPSTVTDDKYYAAKVERIIERALVLYNSSILEPSQQPSKNLEYALGLLKKFVSILRRRRHAIYELPEQDPYLKLSYGDEPDIIQHDLYMYPVVCWATMLIADAEKRFQGVTFDDGWKIESGELVMANDNSNERVFAKLDRFFRKAMLVIEACRFHGRDDDIDRIDAATADVDNHEQSSAKRGTATNNNSAELDSIMSRLSTTDHQLHDNADSSIAKEAVNNLKQLMMLESDSKRVMTNAAKVLSNNGIELNPMTGQLTSSAPSQGKAGGGGAKSGSSNNKKNAQHRKAKVAVGGLTADYHPKDKDRLSIRSEITPNRDVFGRDEVAAWIHWSLAGCGGISLGFLGTAAASAAEIQHYLDHLHNPPPVATINTRVGSVASLNSNISNANNNNPYFVSDTFLTEVRNRLIEVDTRLSMSIELDEKIRGDFDDEDNDDAHSSSAAAATGQQMESRVLILFVLIKVTAQLKLKNEIAFSLTQLEKSVRGLLDRYPASCKECLFYDALAKRMRLDYEQWLMPDMMSNDEKVDYLVMTVLPYAKKYYNTTQSMLPATTIQDRKKVDVLYLFKDAVKKLTNLYISIGNIPIGNSNSSSGGGNNDSVRQQSAKGAKGEKGSNNKAKAAPAPIATRPPTMDELSSLSAEEIDRVETQDAAWVQRYGKLRAKMVLRLFRDRFPTFLSV